MDTGGDDRTTYDESPVGLARRWQREIAASKKEKEKFVKDSHTVVKAFLDKRDEVYDNGTRKINVFWANVQVLKSTLFARSPKADVSPYGHNMDDDVARVGGTMVESMINLDIERDVGSFSDNIKQAIEDWLVPGLGVCWVRYDVETETVETAAMDSREAGESDLGGNEVESTAEGSQSLAPGESMEQISNEDVVVDYVHWDDFFWSPCRVWMERRWTARRVYMTKEKATKRFGEKVAAQLPYKVSDRKTNDPNAPQNMVWAQAEIFEIWSLEDKRVYWYCDGFEVICDYKQDPLGLDTFFPHPKPLFKNLSSSNCMPRADYTMVQDQYESINIAQTRIYWLIKACKVSGVYDVKAEGIQRLFQEGQELKLIPVDQWAMFAEKGGIKGAVDWVPVDMIAAVLEKLRTDIADSKQQIYEVLGLSDIMRGSTRANETATAQELKAQYGSTRLQDYQQTVAQFVSETQQLKAEIISKHVQPATIVERSNVLRSKDAQYAGPAIEFIKSRQGYNGYRVKIEADSLATIDWADERDARTQLLTAIAQYVTGILPVIQIAPQALPVFLELLKWGVGGFKAGKQVETLIDQAIDQLKQLGDKPPDPQAQAQKQAELDKTQSEATKNKAAAQHSTALAAKDIAQANLHKVQTHVAALSAATQVASNVVPMQGPGR